MDIGSMLRLAHNNVVSLLRVIVIEATNQADQCESGGRFSRQRFGVRDDGTVMLSFRLFGVDCIKDGIEVLVKSLNDPRATRHSAEISSGQRRSSD